MTVIAAKVLNSLVDHLFERLTRRPSERPWWDSLYRLPLADLQQRANDGDAKAAYVLGDIYDQGQNGVDQDLSLAVWWYRYAAERGDGDALNNLGSMSQHGDGLPQDDEQARHYYEQGAAAGCGKAMNNLGHFFTQGRGGLRKDLPQSVRWFKKGSRLRDNDAMVSLGYAYDNGVGVSVSPLRALYWFRRAAQAQYPKGYFNLGLSYWAGDIVLRNERKAVALFFKAGPDHVGANYFLGKAYYEGRGIEKNISEGLRLISLAAHKDYELAQEYLQSIEDSPVDLTLQSGSAVPPVYLLAVHAEQMGHWSDAIRYYEKSIALFDTVPKVDENQCAGTQERLAYCLHEAGEYLRARQINEQVLATGERLYGANSSKLNVVLTNLAQNAYMLHDYDTARTLLERRLALSLQHDESAHIDDCLFQLGVLAFEQGRLDDAQALMQRRLDLASKSGDLQRIEDAGDAFEALKLRLDGLQKSPTAHEEAETVKLAVPHAGRSTAVLPTTLDIDRSAARALEARSLSDLQAIYTRLQKETDKGEALIAGGGTACPCDAATATLLIVIGFAINKLDGEGRYQDWMEDESLSLLADYRAFISTCGEDAQSTALSDITDLMIKKL